MVITEHPLLIVTTQLDTICEQTLANLTADSVDVGIANIQQVLAERQVLLDEWNREPIEGFLELNEQVQKKMERIFTHTAEQVRSVRKKQVASQGYRQRADVQGSFFDSRE